MKMRKYKKFIFLSICLAAVITVFFLVSSNCSYDLHYTVAVSGTKQNVLEISVEAVNPIYAEGRTIALYTGDKTLALKSCVDQQGFNLPVQESADSVNFYLGRGKKAKLSYEVQIGSLGKHGRRGIVTDDYCVFDGGEAFLLPMEFYQADYPENKAVVGKLSISLMGRSGWSEAVPYTDIKNVTWADAYDLNNNSFCMGRFYCSTIDSLKIYTSAESSSELTDSTKSGILALYNYYANLFSSLQKNYCVILLPTSDGSDLSVIGGAGTGSVCATFNADSKRDWELLSHRMFHAFFDDIFRTQYFHAAPRLWFYEGMATYYENYSMGILPEMLRTSLYIQPEQQFTSLFNKYLYIKLKDPSLFSLTPMDEENIRKSENYEAKIEFLHYTQAPLVVKLIEDSSNRQSKKSDSILRHLLKNKNNPEQYDYTRLLSEILGTDMNEVYKDYFLSDQILPLWYLQDSTYSQQQTLSDLNDIEYQLASWLGKQTGNYPAEKVDMKTVQKIQNNTKFKSAHFSDWNVEQSVHKYSSPIYLLLKEYALRADICNVPLTDPALRERLLLDEANKVKWNTWVEHAGDS